jgi:hypothetical protein
MARLVWGARGARKYETGVDRGVLYPENSPGVVWNGLVSVDETFTGGDVTSLYYDGIKFLDFVSPRHYQAILTAFSAPEEFQQFIGNRSLIPGFIVTRQPRQQFGLSYRTRIDDGPGHKIHLVYNALASPDNANAASLSPGSQAEPLSWTIDAVPPNSASHRPSAHFVFDTTELDPHALEIIESILYGSSTDDPRLPRFDELIDIVVIGDSLLIVPQSLTGLADLVLGEGDLYRTSKPGIHRALPTTRLVETVVDGLYGME